MSIGNTKSKKISKAMMGEYNKNAYIKMPWGKYKGRYLKEIPDDYMIWAAKNWEDLATRVMFVTELARRKVNWQ